MKEDILTKQQQSTETELEKSRSQVTSLQDRIHQVESSRKDSDSSHMAKIAEVEKTCTDLKLQVRIPTAVIWLR